MSTCKYYKKCEGYKSISRTCCDCSNKERNYCGKFRELGGENEK